MIRTKLQYWLERPGRNFMNTIRFYEKFAGFFAFSNLQKNRTGNQVQYRKLFAWSLRLDVPMYFNTTFIFRCNEDNCGRNTKGFRRSESLISWYSPGYSINFLFLGKIHYFGHQFPPYDPILSPVRPDHKLFFEYILILSSSLHQSSASGSFLQIFVPKASMYRWSPSSNPS
jgi:hypothetical protein